MHSIFTIAFSVMLASTTQAQTIISEHPAGKTYQAGQPVDGRLQELQRRSDEALKNYDAASQRYINTLRKIHQDRCQRAYNNGMPYDVLERYC